MVIDHKIKFKAPIARFLFIIWLSTFFFHLPLLSIYVYLKIYILSTILYSLLCFHHLLVLDLLFFRLRIYTLILIDWLASLTFSTYWTIFWLGILSLLCHDLLERCHMFWQGQQRKDVFDHYSSVSLFRWIRKNMFVLNIETNRSKSSLLFYLEWGIFFFN